MEDYKFNIRAFRRYMLKDKEILEKTQRFLDLPPDLPQDGKEIKRPLPTSDSMTEAARMKFTVEDSSSDEEVSPALPVVATTAGHPATDGHQTANKRKKCSCHAAAQSGLVAAASIARASWRSNFPTALQLSGEAHGKR